MSEMTPKEREFVDAYAPQFEVEKVIFSDGYFRRIDEDEMTPVDYCFVNKDVFDLCDDSRPADACDITLCFRDTGIALEQKWVDFLAPLEICDQDSGHKFVCDSPSHSFPVRANGNGRFAITFGVLLRPADPEDEDSLEDPIPIWDQLKGHRMKISLQGIVVENQFAWCSRFLSGSIDADGTVKCQTQHSESCFFGNSTYDPMEEPEEGAEPTTLTLEECFRICENRPHTKIEKIEFTGGFGKRGDPDFPQTQVFSTDEITKAVNSGALTEYCYATFFFRDKGMPSERKQVRFDNWIQIDCCDVFDNIFDAPKVAFEATADKDGRFSVRLPFWLRTVGESEKTPLSVLDLMKKEDALFLGYRVEVSNSEATEKYQFFGHLQPDGTITDIFRNYFWYDIVRDPAENKPGQPD